MVLSSGVVTGLVMWWCFVPIQYHFDAAMAQSPKAFGWTAEGMYIGAGRLEQMTWPRRREAWVKLPGLATYHEPSVARMLIESEGGKPSTFTLHSTPLTMDEALDRVRHWAKVWNFELDSARVERWRNQATRGGYRGPFGAIGRYERKPGGLDVWLEIRPCGDRDRPWCVGFNLYWHASN